MRQASLSAPIGMFQKYGTAKDFCFESVDWPTLYAGQGEGAKATDRTPLHLLFWRQTEFWLSDR